MNPHRTTNPHFLQHDVIEADLQLTQFFVAASRGDTELVCNYLSNGFSLYTADYLGDTALHFAVKHGRIETVQRLLDLGADINRADDLGFTALHVAVKHENLAMTTLLLQRGSQIDCCTVMGVSVLHIAARSGNAALGALLLQHGAPLESCNARGYTALHEAVERKKIAFTELLAASYSLPALHRALASINNLMPQRYRDNNQAYNKLQQVIALRQAQVDWQALQYDPALPCLFRLAHVGLFATCREPSAQTQLPLEIQTMIAYEQLRSDAGAAARFSRQAARHRARLSLSPT